MNPYEYGINAALTKLGMMMRPPQQQQQPQQPKQGGGGIAGMAKSIFSGGLAGTGGLLSGGMGIPGTGGINPMMGKQPGGQGSQTMSQQEFMMRPGANMMA